MKMPGHRLFPPPGPYTDVFGLPPVTFSNEKWLLLLGLIGPQFAWRICGLEQAGGGKGIQTHGKEGRISGPF
jgi:hypothetical protein